MHLLKLDVSDQHYSLADSLCMVYWFCKEKMKINPGVNTTYFLDLLQLDDLDPS